MASDSYAGQLVSGSPYERSLASILGQSTSLRPLPECSVEPANAAPKQEAWPAGRPWPASPRRQPNAPRNGARAQSDRDQIPGVTAH
jgi:hypothetical protein